MKKRILGGSLEVSEIGYGCMGLSHAYGVALEKRDAIGRIHEAFELGYTFFDTAAVYNGEYADGSPAVNEELVGEALKPLRDKVVIATKGGIYFGQDGKVVPDASEKSFRKLLEQSLKRLKVETIDLYYQHVQDPKVEPEEVAGLMEKFMKEGKIRHWGISNATEDYIRRANAAYKVTAVQLRYSMMASWNEAMFPMLEELDIGMVAYSPLANGFLSGKFEKQSGYDKNLDFRSWMPQYTEEGVEKAKRLLALIHKLAEEKHATPAQISLAWVLCQKPFIVPIPGSSKSVRIRENAEAANIELSRQEMDEINNLLSHSDFEVFGQQQRKSAYTPPAYEGRK